MSIYLRHSLLVCRPLLGPICGGGCLRKLLQRRNPRGDQGFVPRLRLLRDPTHLQQRRRRKGRQRYAHGAAHYGVGAQGMQLLRMVAASVSLVLLFSCSVSPLFRSSFLVAPVGLLCRAHHCCNAHLWLCPPRQEGQVSRGHQVCHSRSLSPIYF